MPGSFFTGVTTRDMKINNYRHPKLSPKYSQHGNFAARNFCRPKFLQLIIYATKSILTNQG